jgi:DNA-binding IclR family transcriptional regulator
MNVQSLDRTFDILELLAQHRNGLGVSDIGRRLELHKSTVSRLLRSLEARGYIARDPSTGLYRLGLKFIELVGAQLDNLELRIEAKPAMHQLAQATGQTAFLAIRQGREAAYVEKAESFDSLRRYSIIGTRVPLHCSALGKALLTACSPAFVRDLLGGAPLEKRTENTLTSIEALLDELRAAREWGFTMDREENEDGVRCVAAPIEDYRGEPIAAVSVSGYAAAFDGDELEYKGAHVVRAAQEISRRLGRFARDPQPKAGEEHHAGAEG